MGCISHLFDAKQDKGRPQQIDELAGDKINGERNFRFNSFRRKRGGIMADEHDSSLLFYKLDGSSANPAATTSS
jgi:hypothetical protein